MRTFGNAKAHRQKVRRETLATSSTSSTSSASSSHASRTTLHSSTTSRSSTASSQPKTTSSLLSLAENSILLPPAPTEPSAPYTVTTTLTPTVDSYSASSTFITTNTPSFATSLLIPFSNTSLGEFTPTSSQPATSSAPAAITSVQTTSDAGQTHHDRSWLIPVVAVTASVIVIVALAMHWVRRTRSSKHTTTPSNVADASCNENEPTSNPSAVMSNTTITNLAPEFHGVTLEQDSYPAWLPEYPLAPPSTIAPSSVVNALRSKHSRLSGYSDVKVVPATPSSATSIWHPSSPVVNPSPYSLADLANPPSENWNVDGVPTMGQGVAPSFAQAPDGSAQNARRPPTEPLRALIHQGTSSQASCVYPSPIHASSTYLHTSIPHPVGPLSNFYPALQSAAGPFPGRRPGLPIQQAEWSESQVSVAPPRVWLISEHGAVIYTQATHLPVPNNQNDPVSDEMGLQEDPSLRVTDPRVLPPPPYAGKERDVHDGGRAWPMV